MLNSKYKTQNTCFPFDQMKYVGLNPTHPDQTAYPTLPRSKLTLFQSRFFFCKKSSNFTKSHLANLHQVKCTKNVTKHQIWRPNQSVWPNIKTLEIIQVRISLRGFQLSETQQPCDLTKLGNPCFYCIDWLTIACCSGVYFVHFKRPCSNGNLWLCRDICERKEQTQNIANVQNGTK